MNAWRDHSHQTRHMLVYVSSLQEQLIFLALPVSFHPNDSDLRSYNQNPYQTGSERPASAHFLYLFWILQSEQDDDRFLRSCDLFYN